MYVVNKHFILNKEEKNTVYSDSTVFFSFIDAFKFSLFTEKESKKLLSQSYTIISYCIIIEAMYDLELKVVNVMPMN